jgi:phenylpropionate dioxygenase-like ring-hydroxylating dioxygenase large terminal subunit
MLQLNGYWYIAARSSDLGRTPIGRLVEGEPLVLFRDSSGKVHVLLDRCAHRGMALSCGRVVGDCVECPYHGWRYDSVGEVRVVPALCAAEALPRPKTVRSFPAVECDQHIWVWVGKETPSKPPFHFPHCAEPGWTTFFMHTRFEAPVEACLENFLDVPHTLFVHAGLFRGETKRTTRARIRRGSTWVEAEFLNEQPMQGLGPRLMFPQGTVMGHTDCFLLPSISRVDYTFGDDNAFVITSQCTQREEFVVDVTTAITWRLAVPTWLAKPFLRFYCRRVIRQDVAILKTVGGQLKRFGPVYTSTAADLLGSHIRGLRQQAAQGSPALERDGEQCQETVLMI